MGDLGRGDRRAVHPNRILLDRVIQHAHAIHILVLCPLVREVTGKVSRVKSEVTVEMMVGEHLAVQCVGHDLVVACVRTHVPAVTSKGGDSLCNM